MLYKISKTKKNKAIRNRRKSRMNGGKPPGLQPSVLASGNEEKKYCIVVFGSCFLDEVYISGRWHKKITTNIAIASQRDVELRCIERTNDFNDFKALTKNIRTLTFKNEHTITALALYYTRSREQYFVIGDVQGVVSVYIISAFITGDTLRGDGSFAKINVGKLPIHSIYTHCSEDNLNIVIYAGNQVRFYQINEQSRSVSLLGDLTRQNVSFFDVTHHDNISSWTFEYPSYRFVSNESDNQHFITWMTKNNLDVFDYSNEEYIPRTHEQTRCAITCLKMHPSQAFLITGDSQGVLRLWDIMNWHDEYLTELRIGSIEGFIVAVAAHSSPVQKIVFHPNKYLFATLSQNEVKLWGLDKFFRTMTLLETITPPYNVTDIVFHPLLYCLVMTCNGDVLSFHFDNLDKMEIDMSIHNDYGELSMEQQDKWSERTQMGPVAAQNPDHVFPVVYKGQELEPNHWTIKGYSGHQRAERNPLNVDVAPILPTERHISCEGVACSAVTVKTKGKANSEVKSEVEAVLEDVTENPRAHGRLPPGWFRRENRKGQIYYEYDNGKPAEKRTSDERPITPYVPIGWELEEVAGKQTIYYHEKTGTWSNTLP
jgi:WD40 repeat protein